MKKSILFHVLASAFILIFACQAPKSPDAVTSEPKSEAEETGGSKFNVDTKESFVEWIGTKVSGYHTGTLQISSGELMVTAGQITSGNFVLNMTSIAATGPAKVKQEANTKLTGHLHSADFFDVNKFPEATFVITSVKPYSGSAKEHDDPREEKINKYRITNPTHTISGNLTIKGIEKNIEFPAQITISDNSVEAQAKFNIDRKQWDITYAGQPDDLIRDDIHLGIYLKAVK